MKNIILIFQIFVLSTFSTYSQTIQHPRTITWHIDNVDSIAGYATEKIGNPLVVNNHLARSVFFNGKDDGLIVAANPLSGFKEFTIEIIFRPDTSFLAANKEQRFLHIQESNDRRILIELRLTGNNRWFLDTFIKSDTSKHTLYSNSITHPANKWYHAALVYKDGTMKDYVNGELELSGSVNFIPMNGGKVSIGVRQDLRSWFKGNIKTIVFTNKAFSPSEFKSLKIKEG